MDDFDCLLRAKGAKDIDDEVYLIDAKPKRRRVGDTLDLDSPPPAVKVHVTKLRTSNTDKQRDFSMQMRTDRMNKSSEGQDDQSFRGNSQMNNRSYFDQEDQGQTGRGSIGNRHQPAFEDFEYLPED